MITRLIEFNVTPGQETAFQSALVEEAGTSRPKPGCAAMRLYGHNDNPGVFSVFEQWENQPALGDHMVLCPTS